MDHTSVGRGRRALLAGLPALLAATTLATVPTSTAQAAPDDRRTTVVRQQETGKVGFIGTAPGHAIDTGQPEGTPAGEVARAFLRERARQLGLDSARTGLAVRGQHATAAGHSVRVQQEHAGVPVLGGEFTVNLDRSGDVLSVLGEASPITGTATEPAVAAAAAGRTALGAVAKSERVAPRRLGAAPPVLHFYDPRLLGAPGPLQEARLAWVVEVTGDGIAHTVVVDAARGTVSLDFSTLAHAKDRTVCDAGNTAGAYPCTTPVWSESSQPPTMNADVQLAFEYAGDTYDFFASRLGRDSLDDAGMTLVSTVDYCPSPASCPYENAFWDGSQMVYGEGFASADDVVGHELAHGVTDHSSSLFYYAQSGAINEAMSDIFGELIDLGNGAGTDDPASRWLMGEDIPGFGAIRDMQDPPSMGQPDRMQSPYYTGDVDELDGGGVHTNSGVANKAAYLLVDGATFNGQTVGAIGADRTALVFYTANNDLLVSGSDYADLANALRQACSNLVGTAGITAANCTQVDRALLATQMDQDPMNAPTGSVAPCPTGAVDPVRVDDLESDTGQFMTTSTNLDLWFYPQNTHPYDGYDATYATSGDTNIWGDDPWSPDGVTPATSDASLRMTSPVHLPAGAYLHFRHAYGFEDGGNMFFYDGGVLEYSTSGAGGPWVDAGPLMSGDTYGGTLDTFFDNPLGGRNAFVAESNGYGSTRVDLASLAGRDVMFRWRIGADSDFGDYGWFIDDISIHTCGAADTTPPDTTITSGPAEGSTITTTTATFGFGSTEAGSTFTCSLDGAAYTACTSPRTVTGLTDGAHTFRVRARDAAGNTDATPATRSFTVETATADTTPPNTRIVKHPRKRTTSKKATFTFRSTEAGSTFQCKLDRKRWQSCTSPKRYRVKKGKHTFRVRATDATGNRDASPATFRWTVRRRR